MNLECFLMMYFIFTYLIVCVIGPQFFFFLCLESSSYNHRLIREIVPVISQR